MIGDEDIPPHEHQWVTIHHLDIEGRHYCPTGYAECAECDTIRVLDEYEVAASCRVPWGELPDGEDDGGAAP